MKKLLFLSALLFFFQWVSATELPKLNLEIGKAYTIETIDHIDTSAQNPVRNWDQCKWLFTPISYNPSTQSYRMKAILDYYEHVYQEKDKTLGWREKTVYETGYLQNYRSQMVFLNLNKVPFYFNVTKIGIVDSFDFSEYNNYKTPEGLQLRSYVDEEQYIGRDIQLLFFHRLASEPSDRYAHRFYLNISQRKSDYKLVKQDSSSITIEMVPTLKDSSRFIIDFINEQLTLDKKTGLILQRHFNYRKFQSDCSKWKNNQQCELKINSAVYCQKYIPEYSLNNNSVRMFQHGEWRDSLISKANMVFKCKISNRIAGEDSVDIHLGAEENDFQRIALNKNNEIEVGLTLINPTLVEIRYPRIKWGDSPHEYHKNRDKSTYFFQAAAGDNFNMELWVNNANLELISVNGIYSTVFNHEKEFQLLNGHPMSDIFSVAQKEEYLPFLNEFRIKADPRIYIDKLFGVIYWEGIHNIINYRQNASRTPASFQTKHQCTIPTGKYNRQ